MNGILFIGDLLINTSAPGRRIDDDFLMAVKNKIKFALNLAKEKELQPVVVGQAFYKSFDVKVLTEIIPLLKDNNVYFLPSLVDQNSKSEEILSKSTMGILEATGIIKIIDSHNPFEIDINGSKCALHFSNNTKKFEEVSLRNEINILLMRHPLFSDKETIDNNSGFNNIDIIVNAGTKKENDEFITNNKRWKNLGPSVRIHTESESFSPKVFEWNPNSGFKGYILPHQKYVMNHDAIISNEQQEKKLIESDFAKTMKEEMDRMDKEDDVGLIESELSEILISKNASLEIREQISVLQKEVELL